MVRSKRLQPIKKLAQNHEKEAAQALGQSLDQQKIEAQKLTQLEQYREEYRKDMAAKVAQGVSGESLQRYHQFLAKLDTAIEQQQQVLSQCRATINDHQDQWQHKRSRTRAISQVMDKMQEKEQAVESKKEAAQLDELSTQAFLRRQS